MYQNFVFSLLSPSSLLKFPNSRLPSTNNSPDQTLLLAMYFATHPAKISELSCENLIEKAQNLESSGLK